MQCKTTDQTQKRVYQFLSILVILRIIVYILQMFQLSRKFTNSEDVLDLDKPISLSFQNNNTYLLF